MCPDLCAYTQTISLLGQMLKARQPNIRYLGLEAMSRLVASRDVQRLVKEVRIMKLTD